MHTYRERNYVMLVFICLFFPAVISLAIYEKLTEETLTIKKTVYFYILFNLLINFFILAIKTFITGSGDTYLPIDLGINISTATFYMITALPLAVIISFIAALIKRNVKVEIKNDESKIEETKNEEAKEYQKI